MIKTLNNRQIKMNKSRVCMTVLAIMLTCILLTSVLTMTSHLLVSMQDTTSRQMGSSAHAGFKYLDMETAREVVQHSLFKEAGLSVVVGLLDDETYNKRNVEIRTMDDQFRTFMYMDLIEGRTPLNRNEIVIDNEWLYYNDVQFSLGETITLDLVIGYQKITESFKIVGIAEGTRIGPVSHMLISDELAAEYLINHEGDNYTGAAQVLGNFNSTIGMERKLNKIAQDYKLDIDLVRGSVNPAYQVNISEMNPAEIIGFVMVFIILMLSGYLIIYNIYYIAVTKEVRYYGLLKTIGMTSKQIKKMLLTYNFKLTLLGLPVGLAIGYGLGSILIPVVISTLNIENVKYSFNLWVFVFSGLLTLLTTYLSCKKPAKVASMVSPIEALRTYDIQYNKKSKARRKSNIRSMAWRSLFSNKRKTIMVIISLALSMTILMSVTILVAHVDPNEMIKRSIGTDYIIGHSNYFSYDYNRDLVNNVVPESLLESLGDTAHPMYVTRKTVSLKDSQRDAILTKYDVNSQDFYLEEIKAGQINMTLFGTDKFVFDLLNDYVIEGEIPENMTANQLVIDKDFFANTGMSLLPINVGESLTIDDVEYEIVAAVYNLPLYLYEQSYTGSWIKGFRASDEGHLMNVMGNDDIDKKSIMSLYPKIVAKTRADYLDEVNNYVRMIQVIGYTLSAILFVIGILNFVNMQATSILIRRRMFAVLESIGMKKAQLKHMLLFEGLFIAMFAAAISILQAMVIQYLILNEISLSYLTSGLIFIMVLSVIILLFPLIVYNVFDKSTIVERLRGDI